MRTFSSQSWHFPPAFRRYIHLTQRMLTFGPDLGMPHSRALGKGLFELRLKSKEGIGRVFFCTRPGRRIVMLHALVKKSQKTPAKELKLARQRQKEVQARADTPRNGETDAQETDREGGL